MSTPTPAQVREHVSRIRQKVRDARVIGIRADDWRGVLDVEGAPFKVVLCRAPLHVREELLDLTDGSGLIVLTPVSEQDLGGDVIARFAKRQLFDIDTWSLALDLFNARGIDPRVQRARWLADALVENAPPGGYEPVPSGVLDNDTVWEALLRRRLGLPDGRPDVVALLRWADTPGAVERYTSLPPEFRDGVRQRVRETAGTAAVAMLDALELAPGADLLAMGLGCRVLFEGNAVPELREAAVRFERFHPQQPFPREAGVQWADAAERVLAEQESELGWAAVRARVDRADRLLGELGAGAFLHLGRWTPGGFEQRLARFADLIAVAIDDRSRVAAADEAASHAVHHRLARLQEARGRRIEMAARLLRWLHASGAAQPASLADAVQAFCREGAFVDLARLALLGGDQPPELARAYATLLTRARERREIDNERFARLLAESDVSSGSGQVAVVPVERVAEEVVAPIARERPALLLVMDGLSRPVYHELLDAIVDEGWRLLKPERPELGAAEWAALAVVPSITEVSRTSLLCGRLVAGAAADEKRGFSTHAALVHASRSRRPPLLFHKGELLEPSGRGLSTEVRDAIAAEDQRIVGVVLNVVDDLLFKGDQFQPRWTLDAAPLLRQVLDAARTAGRAVVLTSDHGHLLDDDSAFQGREAGDRWREDAGQVAAGEVRVTGRRVLAGGRSSAIVPWSERTRYSPRKNGYHGGLTPQEMVLPLAVLAWGEAGLNGFVEAPLQYPPWWFESAGVAERPREPVAPVVTPATKPKPLLEVLEPAAPEPLEAREVWWVRALLESERYAEQKALASGRGVAPDDEVRRVLVVLAERGGRMTRVALAQRLGVPPVRLPGLVAATRRLLNVDGLQVLELHQPSDTLVLNVPLLEQQFELRKP